MTKSRIDNQLFPTTEVLDSLYLAERKTLLNDLIKDINLTSLGRAMDRVEGLSRYLSLTLITATNHAYRTHICEKRDELNSLYKAMRQWLNDFENFRLSSVVDEFEPYLDHDLINAAIEKDLARVTTSPITLESEQLMSVATIIINSPVNAGGRIHTAAAHSA